MTAKFKAGDRVIRNAVGPGRTLAKPGDKATVFRVDHEYVYVQWAEKNGQADGAYYPDIFDLDREAPGTYIVIVEKNGKLAPSTTPKTYKSKEQADKVAEQMATRHGGKFYVFKAVSYTELPPPVVVTPKKVELI